MLNFFRYNRFNSFVLLSTLLTFSTATALPIDQYNYQALGLNDVALVIKINKFIDKAKKYMDRQDQDKIIDLVLDLRDDVQAYTGNKIDISKHLDHIEKESKKQGAKQSSKEFKFVKEKIKKKDKRRSHKAEFINECISLGIDYDDDLEALVYEAKHKDKDKENEKEDKKEEIIVELPYVFVAGVTISLAGLFITCIPIPICKEWGPRLVMAGFSMVVRQCAQTLEDQKKEEKEKNK